MPELTVTEAIKQRRSIRGFQDQQVPQEVLQEIFTTANGAPSNCNTQPWHVSVVSGAKRDQLAEALVAEILSGKRPQFDFKPGDANLSGIYKERQFDCAMRLYGTMGIDRKDRAKRNELMLQNWQFFGAPHVAFISMPSSMGEVNAVDIGIYLQTLMLLLVEHGLGSVPQGALAMYPDPVREIVGIPEGNSLICGLSFGYPADDEQINKVITDRVSLETNVVFVQ